MSDDQVKLLIDGNECIGFGECVSEDPDAVELGADVARPNQYLRAAPKLWPGASYGDSVA